MTRIQRIGVAFVLATGAPFLMAASDAELPWRDAVSTWKASIGERPSSGPWLAGDSVVYFGYSGKLVSLSASGGETRWEAKLEGPHMSPPALLGGIIVVGVNSRTLLGNGGRLVALDTRTGAERWTIGTRTRPIYPATPAGDVVIATSEREWVAVDRETGKEAWRLRTESGALEPTVAGDTVLLPESRAALHAVDARSGKEKWRFLRSLDSFARGDDFAREAAAATSSVEARRFFSVAPSRDVYRFGLGACEALAKGGTDEEIRRDLRQFFGEATAVALLGAARKSLCPDGTTLDQLKSLARAAEPGESEGLSSAASVHGDSVFFATRSDDGSGAVHGLLLDSGAEIFRVPARRAGAPVSDGKAVYFVSNGERNRAELHAVDMATRQSLWDVDLSPHVVGTRSRLVLAGGYLYIRALRIDTRSGAVETGMPVDLDGPQGGLDCFRVSRPGVPRSFIAKFDLATSTAAWAFRGETVRNPSLAVACGDNRVFFYDDWGDYPLYGVRLKERADP